MLLNADCETLARLPNLCDIDYHSVEQNGRILKNLVDMALICEKEIETAQQ